MPDEFPDLKSGDALEPWHFNVIYDELRAWRKLKGSGGATVSYTEGEGSGPVIDVDCDEPFFIQLTSAYASGYDWKEVKIGPSRLIQASGIVGTAALGDPAYELQTGDTTLTVDGTVYEAHRSSASNQVLFDGKN